MRLRPLTLLTAALFFMCPACYAQPADRQRLQATLLEKQSKKDFFKDTSYINALNEMAHSWYSVSVDSLFRYAGEALTYARNAGYQRGESFALRQLGNGYKLKGDYINMLTYYLQSLVIAEKINDPTLMGNACLNIALQYVDMHKNEEAMEMAVKAKHYFEKTGDGACINKSLIAAGEVWFNRRQFDSAMNYFRQAYLIAQKMNNTYLLISSNDEVASVLLMKGRYKEALAIYLHALEYYRHTGDDTRQALAARDVAWSYLKLKQYRKVLQYAHISQRISYEQKTIIEMKWVCGMLADAYKGLGDYRNASKYLSRFISLSDTIYNQQVQRNTARLEARYEYEKKEVELKEEQAKKDIRHKAIVRTQQLEIGFSIAVIIFLSILAHILCRSKTAKQKANAALMIMNAEINRQKEEIEAQSLRLLINNQQKDKLFSIISHDLKTPLHSLHTVLDLLKANALSKTQISRMIEELRHEVDYSSELVANLLSWSNSQLNGTIVKPVPFNLRALTEEVLHLYKIKAAQKQIVLRNCIHPSLQGYADKDMMHMIIRNLVSNAVKFCKAGDTVTVGGKTAGDTIEICVSDTGTGIDKDILDKINHQRIVTTYGTAHEKGTGLGMLLCREFIALNHGLLRVESEWTEGTRCLFTLPRLQRQAQTAVALPV